jgi:ABC-2 type transport system permease protein
MSIDRIKAVTRKEIYHILRDRMTLILVLFTPTILLFIMAYAITVDIKRVPIAILDYDRSSVSRALIQQISAGEDLDLYAQVASIEEIEDLLSLGRIKAALIVDPSFAKDLISLRGFPLQIIIDGTEPQSGGFAVDHIVSRTEEFINSQLANQIQALGLDLASLQSIDLRIRTWYNPSLKPRVDLIPGLISMVLGLPALSVALTLAYEREHGTFEQLLATPISRIELLLGKMIPYILFGLLNVVLIPLVAIAWFKIPFNGNFLIYFLLSAFFLFAILGLGMIVGVFMRTQAAALALSFLVIFFPGFFLTGIFFQLPQCQRLCEWKPLHFPVLTMQS